MWTTTATTACTNTFFVYVTYTATSATTTPTTASNTYHGMANHGMANTCNTWASSREFLVRERARQGRILEQHSEAVRERARALLLTQLTDEQRETFEKNGWFVVEGGKSGRKYRVAANDNCAANIYVLDGERVTHRLCGHCDLKKVPLADHLLAQKLMLESAEEEFLRIANRHAA